MKSNQPKKKRAVTLVELIVVIALISIITAALAVNYRGSLDAGKQFKKKQAAQRIVNILDIKIGDGTPMQEVVDNWNNHVRESPLGGAKFADETLNEFHPTIIKDEKTQQDIVHVPH
jgi:prepilin-type N-terminal cleavage/methylation domain-containing protein